MAPARSGGSRPRRVSLPGVAELLRQPARRPAVEPQRQASGRESHPQKITVYLSGPELIVLERARLALRAYGISVDRGRVVREAMAIVLADLESAGQDSLIVQRLRGGKFAARD